MGVYYRHNLIHKAAKPLVCLNKANALLKGILQQSFPLNRSPKTRNSPKSQPFAGSTGVCEVCRARSQLGQRPGCIPGPGRACQNDEPKAITKSRTQSAAKHGSVLSIVFYFVVSDNRIRSAVRERKALSLGFM